MIPLDRIRLCALLLVSSCTTVACKTEPCPPGFYRQGDRCVNPNDPVEKYAGCIIRDAKQRVTTDKGTTIEARVEVAKVGVSSTADFKDKFEKNIEASTDRCILLDVSARCFALASGDKTAPAIPMECGGGIPADGGGGGPGDSGALPDVGAADAATPPPPPKACGMRCEGSGDGTRLRIDPGLTYRFELRSMKASPHELHVLSDKQGTNIMLVENSAVGNAFTMKDDALKVCSKIKGTGGGCHWSCSVDVVKGTARFFTDQLSADFTVTCQ